MPTRHIKALAFDYKQLCKEIARLETTREATYERISEELSIWAAESGADREFDFDIERKLEELLDAT